MASDRETLDDEPDLDELFAEAEELGTAEVVVRRALRLIPVVEDVESETLRLDADEVQVTAIKEEDACRLSLLGTVENVLGRTVELDELQVVLRDADGDLVDFDDHWLSTKFVKAQEIVAEFSFGPQALDHCATVDLLVDYEFEFQQLLAMAAIDPADFLGEVPHRVPLHLTTKVAPSPAGMPEFDARIAAWVGYTWESEVDVLLQVGEKGFSESQTREIVVALRDHQGEIVAKDTAVLARVGAEVGPVVKVNFSLPPDAIAALARIDVAISGTCERRQRLGRFRLVGTH